MHLLKQLLLLGKLIKEHQIPDLHLFGKKHQELYVTLVTART
jgi:hypothetical protein